MIKNSFKIFNEPSSIQRRQARMACPAFADAAPLEHGRHHEIATKTLGLIREPSLSNGAASLCAVT